MIDPAQKLFLLSRVYDLYDQYTDTLTLACRKSCAACCTCNVSVTTLEAQFIINALRPDRLQEIKSAIEPRLKKSRFIPQITFNRLADLCVSGWEPPHEPIEASWGACPVLADQLCPIYGMRPFGCRCMVSTQSCGNTDTAVMDEFTVTVNHLFFQVIEHIDQDGLSGNLSDVMDYVLSRKSLQLPQTQSCLIRNAHLRTLLVPPEHRDKITPILNQIRSLPI